MSEPHDYMKVLVDKFQKELVSYENIDKEAQIYLPKQLRSASAWALLHVHTKAAYLDMIYRMIYSD